MSQTESLGVADAARWVGVAASMTGYLQSWLAEPSEQPPVPRGIFAGARRFLDQALVGIALDRRERPKPEIPIMAGISNLNIALGVLYRLERPGDLKQVEATVKAYLFCLKSIEESKPRSQVLVEQAQAVKAFFAELQKQGNRANHAAFAKAGSPQV